MVLESFLVLVLVWDSGLGPSARVSGWALKSLWVLLLLDWEVVYAIVTECVSVCMLVYVLVSMGIWLVGILLRVAKWVPELELEP